MFGFALNLVGALGYRGPEIVAGALDACAPGRRFGRGLDLGCGSGLMARAVRDRVDHLSGVDLSAAMIARARASGLYDEAQTGDLVAFLGAQGSARADLILAADTLIYLGDLQGVFAAAASALAPGGLFAFTLESGEDAPFELHDHLRFRHSDAHIGDAAQAADLRTALLAPATTRRESGAEAPGRVVVLARD